MWLGEFKIENFACSLSFGYIVTILHVRNLNWRWVGRIAACQTHSSLGILGMSSYLCLVYLPVPFKRQSWSGRFMVNRIKVLTEVNTNWPRTHLLPSWVIDPCYTKTKARGDQMLIFFLESTLASDNISAGQFTDRFPLGLDHKSLTGPSSYGWYLKGMEPLYSFRSDWSKFAARTSLISSGYFHQFLEVEQRKVGVIKRDAHESREETDQTVRKRKFEFLGKLYQLLSAP